MTLFPAVGEGIIAALFLGLISKRRPEFRTRFFVLLILIEIASVVLRYSGQEDSSLFFWHPYLVLVIANLSDYSNYKRGLGAPKVIAFEKLLLWPVIIIPVMSGFVLTVGWLIKVYHRDFFQIFGTGI
ncbi:MAG: hypothetical protein K5989_08265 [Lachnospiraceae bacterium]|nr:hypothetical protein [Lachnospiraceae bacterium]